jgi:ATP-dependent 26S proteasome regulatory subunit
MSTYEAPQPVDMYPMPAKPVASQAEIAATQRIESLKILDRDELKLGDLNPLVHPVDLTRKESIDAVRYTTLEKIQECGGLLPEVLESAVVCDLKKPEDTQLRFVARFEVPNLTEGQLVLLEELVGQTYDVAVRTRRDSKGNKIQAESYLPTQFGDELKSKTGGWYMGPGAVPTSSLHQGLFVFKDLGEINEDNFFVNDDRPGKYIVEVREGGLQQTDLVAFVTQVASVLGQEKLLDKGQLLYETYYDLMRLGLKKVEPGSIHGMDDAIDAIRRQLIIPLASPDISGGVGEDPQSVLMIGVPGTGKTLVAERLLQEETGLFILPIDPFELQKELMQPKEKQRLMPRIAEVGRVTGRRVVLHVDDIENMVGENEHTNSTLLNLMAGVQESGFYIMASTNYPEKINPSLIQPQRFSVLLHCGLQNEKARYEILKIHADMESRKLGMPLFSSDEVRDIILGEVAAHTNNFTPRYLANIATIAKSHLIDRIAKDKGKIIGLTEEDLKGYAFVVADWEKAFAEVASKYDSEDVRKRDEQLRQFVKKHTQRPPGFASHEADRQRIFTPSVVSRIVAAEVKLRNPSTGESQS